MDLVEALRVLELQDRITLADAEQAYRMLTKVWHPDRFTDPKLREQAAARQGRLNEAIQTLRDHFRNHATVDPTFTRTTAEGPTGQARTHSAPAARDTAPSTTPRRVVRPRLNVFAKLGLATGTSAALISFAAMPSASDDLESALVFLASFLGPFLFFHSVGRLTSSAATQVARWAATATIRATALVGILLTVAFSSSLHSFRDWAPYALALLGCVAAVAWLLAALAAWIASPRRV